MPTAIAPPPTAIASSRRARLIKWLIWAFCLLLVAGSWWFVAAQTAFERRQAIEDAIRQNVNRTIAFEQYVRRTIEAADLVTRYVSGRFARGDAGGEFAGRPGNPARISGNLGRGGPFLGVSIADENGDIIATSTPLPSALTNVADRPAFRAHLRRDTGRLYISAPTESSITGRNVIWLSRRLNHPDGSFAGVMAVNVPPEQLTAFYRDARVGPMDVMSVIGLDGIARARRVGSVISAGEDFSSQPFMRRQLANPSGTYLGTSVMDGVDRYFSQRRLEEYPLFVVYGVSAEEVLEPSRHRARIFIAGAALLSLMLIAFAALLTLVLNRRERREVEMAQANHRLQEAQRIGQIGDWHYNVRTGETFWSPQLLAMYEREGQGSPTLEEFLAYLNEDGRAVIRHAHEAAIRTGEAQEVEYMVHLPSGAETYHQSAIIPAKDASGRVVRLHGTDQNISARKLLDLLQTHVAHLSRVEAMNAMAATLAHELNQPLTSAANFLVGSRGRLKARGAEALDEAVEGMAAAEHQVHLAANIIRGVREMLSNQPKTLVSVSLTRIVDDAAALIAMADTNRRFEVDKEIAANARTVKGDRIQLQQVMVNLLRNAHDSTEGVAAPEILVSSRREGPGSVTVCVDDNDPGFSQPMSERFSPFATTKSAGLGLGVSISRTIIEAHGGRIWTEDREGGGARICFTLPSARRKQGEADGGAEESESA
ncbi:MAG: ATP-binding protein [Sphingosinicella sp.]|uniref:ATP-binding protein n=1 Tax=Sphingosinicella sp. TaxID=1917971 RepID=UPI004037EA14